MTDQNTNAPNPPDESTAVARREDRAPVQMGSMGVEFRNLDDLARFSKMVVRSGMAPKGLETPEAVGVAVQMGLEVGLSPMAAIQNIACINNRPAIYGDAALALVRRSGLLEHYSQAWTGEGDKRACTVRLKRKGEAEIVSTFSVADAKLAKLWGKPGPWAQYPDRMLMFRARGFGLRDGFGDVLKGMYTAEEARDVIDVTATDVSDQPPETGDIANRLSETPETPVSQPDRPDADLETPPPPAEEKHATRMSDPGTFPGM